MHAPKAVFREVADPGRPELPELERAVKEGWIRLVDSPRDASESARYGLAEGEASLFLASGRGDILLLDDRNARRHAESRGVARIGLIGLLVRAVREDRLGRVRARAVLDALARSDFRMTVELYQWALSGIRGA